MLRRIAVWLAVTAAIGIGGRIAWEFGRTGRPIPPQAAPADRAASIVVEKAARRLSLIRDGKVLKTYAVSLGGHPAGHKQQQGDSRTPEGVYTIDSKNARSRFHLALRVSYPNAADRRNAARRGVAPGGDIMIHGLPNGFGWLGPLHLLYDWTDGCIAVTDAEIEDIWSRVDTGTLVDIRR